jgi:hypothetical protein
MILPRGKIWAVFALVLCSIVSSCGPDKSDEEFADRFLKRMAAGDSTAMDQVVPNGDLARAGWTGMAPFLSYLTAGEPRLERGETVAGPRGADRKLTYRMTGNSAVVLEVWIERQADRRFINTLKASRF